MKYCDAYIDRVRSTLGNDAADHLAKSIQLISSKVFQHYKFLGRINGLLVGHVQSGKTGSIIGFICAAIDRKVKLCVVLTQDSILLHSQTLSRIRESLPSICVCGELDEAMFLTNALRSPCIVVLKKNQSVLRRWASRLISVDNGRSEPLFLIDDEADQASLNTLVNKRQVSTINRLIKVLIDQAPTSFYLQVTATPFANLLLNEQSSLKPVFVMTVDPPATYLGGEFFYGEASDRSVSLEEAESVEVLSSNGTSLPSGLKQAIRDFVVLAIKCKKSKKEACNFLLHSSHKITHHRLISVKVNAYLASLLNYAKQNNQLVLELFSGSAPSQSKLTMREIISALEDIKVIVVNSESYLPDLCVGINIIVGGNCLSRGLTIPQLNLCYYTRSPKTSTADALMQHSRIFGYDRDRDNVRIYLTKSLLQKYRGLVVSAECLHRAIKRDGLDELKFFLPEGISPSRKSVINSSTLISLSGGVNYFIESCEQSCTSNIDIFIAAVQNGASISLDTLLHLLGLFKTTDELLGQFKSATSFLLREVGTPGAIVYKRFDRSLSRNTGTMLSPDDRLLSNSHPSTTVVFLYRIIGEIDKGWSGNPIWLLNIRFPDNFIFFGMEESQ